MHVEKSKDALFEFLNYLSTKGLMAKATVDARKAACGKILGILSDEEKTDITELDLASIVSRFQTLKGKDYTPQSLKTYISRMTSAVNDFKSYLKNPLGYQPRIKSRNVKPKNPSNPQSSSSKSPSDTLNQSLTPQVSRVSDSIMPIPIRTDTIVYVQGLPFDLSKAEAEKIANVIRAMALAT